MPDKVTVTVTEKKYSPFGVELRERPKVKKRDRSKLLEPQVVADEERLGCTKVIFSEIDLREFIHEGAKNCGIAYVLKLMKSGQIDPASIADDGAHGVDISGIPDYIGDAKKLADGAVSDAAGKMIELGLDPSKTYTEEELNAAVSAALKPYFAKAEKKEGEE